MTKSSAEMENHVFLKAKTREEYLALVARLILHVKEMSKSLLFVVELTAYVTEHIKGSNKCVVVQLGLQRYWDLVKDDPETRHHLISVFWYDFHELVRCYKTKCSNCKLIINEFLPMYFAVEHRTKNCGEFRDRLNKSLRSHAAKADIPVVQHRNFEKIDFYDGIHLGGRTGIPKYVRNVRRTIDTLVSIKSDIKVF
ncbi:hypothetical protein FSP39_017684 [Pinctada imbricata]|uniref:Mediator of RNA polymerase II transcription subunit 15 n=1 Tax=Pinctada imbricata TaxID=66713 RepID=A0AA89BW26_PINIB|nr:hypothetical protein FSP39_017684 [Pinctada imbricata]